MINMKLLLGFKYIRFKISMKYISTDTKEVLNIRSKKLSQLFDCSYLTAREIISRNKNILTMDSDEFYRNCTFFQKHLKFSDVIEFPVLISMNSSLLQHRYFASLELGCVNVTGSILLKFPQIVKKTPKELLSEGITFTPDNFDYFNSLLVNISSEDRNDANYCLSKLFKDDTCLSKIKETMNALALSAKLNSPTSKSYWMFRKCPHLKWQSIKNTFDLLDILTHNFKMSIDTIARFTNVINLHPEAVQQFMSKIPKILDVPTEQIVHKIPTILRRPIDAVQNVEAILKQFSISSQQLLCCPKVIVFTQRVLQQRLEYLCNSEDFQLMKRYRKFLWLVYYYNNIQTRLQTLKAVDIPCSISMLTASSSTFEKYLSYGECRTHMIDICQYLAEVFQCSQADINTKLLEFPNLCNSSLINCSQVSDYLLSSGVSKQQLFNGMGVIFYDLDIVKLYFENLENHPECQPFSEWKNHYNLIQLLIYTIEVDTGFRGCQLYKSESKSEDENDFKSVEEDGENLKHFIV